MTKYTIKDFNKQFPNDNACLENMFLSRYEGKTCPFCNKQTNFYKLTNRKAYCCQNCGDSIYPLANTIFHKSETSLKSWYYAIFLMSQSRNGVSAMELQRHLGVTYKTAWRMGKQIRILMSQENAKLKGTVEADETYVGGKGKNNKRGRGAEHKTAVFGMVERKGSVVSKVVENVKSSTVMPIMRSSVALGSNVMTDEFPIYNSVRKSGYNHGVVNHGQKQYVIGSKHTNTIEGFWSQLKRSIDGTYHAVSPKYLQSYVNEFVYRYNQRLGLSPLFSVLLGRVAKLASAD